MGLDQVIADVRQDGEGRAQQVLAEARQEAERLLQQARDEADAYAAKRREQARRDGDAVAAQVASGAEFEARKAVLTTEHELRGRLQDELVEGFGKLPADIRDGHVKKLLDEAAKEVPTGKAWSNAQDKSLVEADKRFTFAGTVDIAGGVIVESDDGEIRLDLSYETLLADLWRDILKAEADLFR